MLCPCGNTINYSVNIHGDEENLCPDCLEIAYKAALEGYVNDDEMIDEDGDSVSLFELENLIESEFGNV